MNNNRDFNVYNMLFRDMNTLRDRVEKLEKEISQRKEPHIPPMIVTDVNIDENLLNITMYDRDADKNTTKSIDLSNEDQDIIESKSQTITDIYNKLDKDYRDASS